MAAGSRKSDAELAERLASLPRLRGTSSVAIDVASDGRLTVGYSGESRPRSSVDGPWPSATGESETLSQLQLRLRKLLKRDILRDLTGERVFVGLPLDASIDLRRAMCECLMGTLQARECVMLPSALCGVVALGMESGTVVEIGRCGTWVVPVYDRRCLRMEAQYTRVGLWSARERAAAYIADRAAETPTGPDLDRFMSQHCTCAPARIARVSEQDPDPGFHPDAYTHTHPRGTGTRATTFTLASGTRIDVDAHVGEVIGESLFEVDSPYAESRDRAIHKVVCDVLANVPIDTRSDLSRLAITGSAYDLPGLMHRIRHDTQARIILHRLGPDLCWTGLSLLAHTRWKGPGKFHGDRWQQELEMAKLDP
ncbi:Actin-related protein 10 [Savitreella phatthalungensis]